MRVPGNSVLPYLDVPVLQLPSWLLRPRIGCLFHKSSLPKKSAAASIIHEPPQSALFWFSKVAHITVQGGSHALQSRQDCGEDLCPSWEKHLGHLQVTSLVYDHRKLWFQAVRWLAPLSLTNLALLPFWWNGL